VLEGEGEKKEGGGASSSRLAPAAWEGSGVAAEGGTLGLWMRAAAEIIVAGLGAAGEAEDGGGGGGGEAPACCSRPVNPTVSNSKRARIGRCCWVKWQGVLVVVVMLLAFVA